MWGMEFNSWVWLFLCSGAGLLRVIGPTVGMDREGIRSHQPVPGFGFGLVLSSHRVPNSNSPGLGRWNVGHGGIWIHGFSIPIVGRDLQPTREGELSEYQVSGGGKDAHEFKFGWKKPASLWQTDSVIRSAARERWQYEDRGREKGRPEQDWANLDEGGGSGVVSRKDRNFWGIWR